jgi:hypothetical protein
MAILNSITKIGANESLARENRGEKACGGVDERSS